jgi:hypothetical protein
MGHTARHRDPAGGGWVALIASGAGPSITPRGRYLNLSFRKRACGNVAITAQTLPIRRRRKHGRRAGGGLEVLVAPSLWFGERAARKSRLAKPSQARSRHP